MAGPLSHPDVFSKRHIGPDAVEQKEMLGALGLASLDALVDATVPKSIRLARPLDLLPAVSESELLARASELAAKNKVFRSYIGAGYSDCVTPPVIQRNILENPGWYTAYTPYQAEVAQGRLEALLNYQTMIEDLTGLPIANASLLDEGTAAAEAMTMLRHLHGGKDAKPFFVSEGCHPQTIDVVRTRAKPLGIEIVVGDHRTFDLAKTPVYGALVQYPATDGPIHDFRAFIEKVHAAGGLVAMAADLLALALLTPPGELGADVALGSAQRFGVPLGYGGPHAAYFATKKEFVRSMPGRLIGVSEDSAGNPALRMALGTREQHIRREKATSNICTAQVLLAVIAGAYATYHGPKGIREIAERVYALTGLLAEALKRSGFKPAYDSWFDTVRVDTSPEEARRILTNAETKQLGFRRIGERAIGLSLDETTSLEDVDAILSCFREGRTADPAGSKGAGIPKALERTSSYLTHPVFNVHHSETEMLRYLKHLESRDLSLTHSMIPLGSCTMKLNATSEMMPVTMPGFGRIHPFAPRTQAEGYTQVFEELEKALSEITGFPGISLQPNAGSQGEYAGLLVIRRHHEARGQAHRSVCLIPESAHGTNPASAAMAGMKVVVTKCDDNGNIDLVDLEAKAKEHAKNLAALMVTYPSTHGVFEEDIKKICSIVHEYGGQVYMDGANMNAQVGLTRPGDIGADVCHLNLHKTFCIPHGGGGPGMGPIGVASHLTKFLPKHPVVAGVGGDDGIGAVSAAPFGSASILLISWAYIRMMGAAALADATRVAILNANYIAKRLEPHFPVLFKGKNGYVAHECILDLRPLKKTSGVEAEDVAKRLMDYGFHAPTLSFPVAGTLMIEPTESEPKAEIDRFCEAMIAIRNEIREVEEGKQPREGNLLKNAPHTATAVIADEWKRSYSRERAVFPGSWVRSHKFWPAVGRVNNAFGDRNLVCACPPIESYAEPKRAAG